MPQELEAELNAKGVLPHCFVRCPEDYYEKDMAFRQTCLGAESVEHLCKSIVMECTRMPDEITDCSDPHASRFIMVVVQYSKKLHPTKLKNLMLGRHREAGGKLSAKHWHYRLATEEKSRQLTGYGHNSVTPICSLTPHMPLIVSHAVAALQPPGAFMFLGAGEVDLKVGFPPKPFLDAYGCIVADVTYNEEKEAA